MWPATVAWFTVASMPWFAAAEVPDAQSDAAVAWLAEALCEPGGTAAVDATRVLRSLRDPAVRPVFVALAMRDDPRVRREAWLGLAELRDPPVLPIAWVAELDHPTQHAERAALLSAALDGGVLDPRDARAMLGWPALEPGVKLMLAVDLAKRGVPWGDLAWLSDLVRGPDPTHRAMAALLLNHSGKPAGTEALHALLDDPATPEATLALLLQTAHAAGLTTAGAFAVEVASAPRHEDLRPLALRTALGVGAPTADRAWANAYQSAGTPAERSRLALVALRGLPETPNVVFVTLSDESDPFLALIGRTGSAVCVQRSHPDAIAQLLLELHGTQHPIARAWLLRWLDRDADDAVFAALASALLSQEGQTAGVAGEQEALVRVTEGWVARRPTEAAADIQSLWSKRQSGENAGWREAVLFGLLREGSVTAADVAHELKSERTREQLICTVLIAQHTESLTADDAALLALGAAGGTDDVALRVRCAWLLVRHGGAIDALRSAVSPSRQTPDRSPPNPRP